VDLFHNCKSLDPLLTFRAGGFTMDLVQARGTGGVPTNTLVNSGAVAGSATTDSNWALVTHMAIMIAAFVILFPTGYLLLRYFDSVKYHWWMQSVAICAVMGGLGIGIYESMIFNKVCELCIPMQTR
jgi:hypothetical protein